MRALHENIENRSEATRGNHLPPILRHTASQEVVATATSIKKPLKACHSETSGAFWVENPATMCLRMPPKMATKREREKVVLNINVVKWMLVDWKHQLITW